MKRTLLVACLALVAACGSKKDKPADNTPPPTTAPMAGSAAPAGSGSAAPTMAGSAAPTMAGSAAGSAAPTMAGSAAAPAAKGSAADVPSTADYEAKAKAEVTDKNVDQQLKDLEKDLPQ